MRFYRWTSLQERYQVQTLPSPTFSLEFILCSWQSEEGHDRIWSDAVPGWALSAYPFHPGPIYRWLPGASRGVLCASGMVCKVRMHEALLCLMKAIFFRCLSSPGELDTISADRSVAHTEQASEIFSQTELASRYGIIKPLVVSSTICQNFNSRWNI